MDFNFKKRYGQNFLQDKNIIDKIILSIIPNPDDLIIEIGLGSGALTKHLVTKSNYYLGYEIDLDVKKYLDQYIDETHNIIYDDFLKRNILEDIKDIPYKNIYLIGNLPYYITTPIILHILESKIPIKECVFMVQKEVALRFTSKPGTRDYGSITVLLDYYADVKYLFEVKRGCFIPSPNVDSAVIKLSMKEREEIDIVKFNNLVRDAFQFKRKNLRNNLKKYDQDKLLEVLNKHGFGLENRAEDLPVEVFIDLTKNI